MSDCPMTSITIESLLNDSRREAELINFVFVAIHSFARASQREAKFMSSASTLAEAMIKEVKKSTSKS